MTKKEQKQLVLKNELMAEPYTYLAMKEGKKQWKEAKTEKPQDKQTQGSLWAVRTLH